MKKNRVQKSLRKKKFFGGINVDAQAAAAAAAANSRRQSSPVQATDWFDYHEKKAAGVNVSQPAANRGNAASTTTSNPYGQGVDPSTAQNIRAGTGTVGTGTTSVGRTGGNVLTSSGYMSPYGGIGDFNINIPKFPEDGSRPPWWPPDQPWPPGTDPEPEPDPDPEPVDPRKGEVTVDRKEGEPPDVQINRGETFDPEDVSVAEVDGEAEGTGLGTVTMGQPTKVRPTKITPARYDARGYGASEAKLRDDYTTSTMRVGRIGDIDAPKGAVGTVSRVADADDPKFSTTVQAAKRRRRDERKALAKDSEFKKDEDSVIDPVTGAITVLSPSKAAEKQTRSAIVGEPAPDGKAAEIMSLYEFDRAQQREIKGAEAKAKVLSDLKAEGFPDDVAEELADDPERLAAAADSLDDGIKTRLSGLPQDALINVQMESLLAGMDEGKTPAWARPALAAVEANLAERGLDVSTVGRDALFNAIIQTSIPIAQANAQAIQAATSQDKTLAGQFLIKNAEFKQQMELANLSNDQQMRLANLSAQNAASRDNLSAAQQTELANLQARVQENIKANEIANSMGLAQLSVDQQRAVGNAMTVAKIDMAKFSNAQQVELTNSKFMQTSTLQDLNNRQQASLQNATIIAQMDLAAADQNTKLAITNARNFLQMDLSNLNNAQQANMLKSQQDQQSLLTQFAADNAAKQFNASSENQKNQFMTNLEAQMNQFNALQTNTAKQFSADAINKARMFNAGNRQQASLMQAQLNAQIDQFNSQLLFQRDQWNAANMQAVLQSNVEWRRKANLVNTAAQNSANQMNAQMQFNLDSAEQAFLWQNLRDEAAYLRQAYENEEQRKTTLYATALGNETSAEKGNVGTKTLKDWIDQIFGIT